MNAGAPIPAGADAVVKVEDTSIVEANAEGKAFVVAINATAKAGQDIRTVGSDIQ